MKAFQGLRVLLSSLLIGTASLAAPIQENSSPKQDSETQATIRDNDMTFRDSSSASFSYQSHSITSGQPWGGVSSLGGGSLRVRAGRKKSSPVANWFNSQSSGGAKMGCSAPSSQPSELNFAVKGTLTLNYRGGVYTCPNFLLGQGSVGTMNNWWITAPGMTTVPNGLPTFRW